MGWWLSWYSDASHQLDVELSDHLHLEVDDVAMAGVPGDKPLMSLPPK